MAAFALLPNFAWEILQAPLYAGMAATSHARATKACFQATIGDAAIMLLAYGVGAVAARSRRWSVASNGAQLAVFVAINVSTTLVNEWLATRVYWIGSWNHQAAMPLVPGTGIGLVPLLTVWFVRRQLAHRAQAVAQGRSAS